MFHIDPDSVGERLLSPATVERMRARNDDDAFHHYYGAAYYGLGWYVRADDGGGRRVVWHEGGMPGASSIIKLLPDDGIAVVVLSNRTDANDVAQRMADALIRVVLPDHDPAPLDPVAGYLPFSGQGGFVGKWSGTIAVDGVDIPCTLDLGADGAVRIGYLSPGQTAFEATSPSMVNGSSLISAFPGRLPSADIGKDDTPLLLLKLVRTGNRLDGAVVAYSSAQRLHYLLPFAATLERKPEQ
jgi:hypothetical protein